LASFYTVVKEGLIPHGETATQPRKMPPTLSGVSVTGTDAAASAEYLEISDFVEFLRKFGPISPNFINRFTAEDYWTDLIGPQLLPVLVSQSWADRSNYSPQVPILRRSRHNHQSHETLCQSPQQQQRNHLSSRTRFLRRDSVGLSIDSPSSNPRTVSPRTIPPNVLPISKVSVHASLEHFGFIIGTALAADPDLTSDTFEETLLWVTANIRDFAIEQRPSLQQNRGVTR
jgi:hypothetical protein